MIKSRKVLGILAVITLLCVTLAGCVEPTLTVEITSPEEGADLTESTVTVSGTVSDPEATLTVNDTEVEIAADGSFSAQVELTEGDNIIEALAVLGEQKVSKSITVTYTPAAPVLSVEITSPEDGADLTESTVTVSGTVSDPEATLTVNDTEVEVAEDGSFSAQVELTEGENMIETVAVLDEQEVSKSITVTYTPAT